MTRHRFDPFSFIAGAVSVGLAVAVLVGRVSIALFDLRIAGPLLFLVLGLTLLLGGGRDQPEPSGATGRRRRRRGGVEPADADTTADGTADTAAVEDEAGDTGATGSDAADDGSRPAQREQRPGSGG